MNIIDKLFNIAKTHFFIETFETRNRDSLDFHTCHVASIKDALEESYEMGAFDIINKNFTLISHENSDESWTLSYINKRDAKVFLKKYSSFKELTDDATKLSFDFGFSRTKKVEQ